MRWERRDRENWSRIRRFRRHITNIPDINFRNLDCREINFRNLDFRKIDFRNLDFRKINFRNFDFQIQLHWKWKPKSRSRTVNGRIDRCKRNEDFLRYAQLMLMVQINQSVFEIIWAHTAHQCCSPLFSRCLFWASAPPWTVCQSAGQYWPLWPVSWDHPNDWRQNILRAMMFSALILADWRNLQHGSVMRSRRVGKGAIKCF